MCTRRFSIGYREPSPVTVQLPGSVFHCRWVRLTNGVAGFGERQCRKTEEGLT